MFSGSCGNWRQTLALYGPLQTMRGNMGAKEYIAQVYIPLFYIYQVGCVIALQKGGFTLKYKT